jgi:hypothetical protein
MGMSHTLDQLARDLQESTPVTLSSLVERFGTRSHLMATLFLCVPFLQPIPTVGLSTLFGVAIITISVAYAFGKPPYIPKRYRERPIPNGMTRTICEKGASLFRWLEKYMKPRGKFMAASWSRVLAAIVMVVCAVLLALPIPLPASNTIPTVPIVLLALGLLEDDGYVVLAGYVAFVVALVCFAILILGPVLGFLYLTS